MRAAGVVLAGGRSSRMGTSKAALEWHGSTLLRRVVGVVGRGVEGHGPASRGADARTGGWGQHGPVFVVRAPGQGLPELPAEVVVVEDPAEGRGPLQGIAVGLAAAAEADADAAFVCSTDLPFLHVAFVRCVLRALVEPPVVDVVVPHARGHRQPLAAAYRTALAPLAAELVAAGRLKPAFLFDEASMLVLDDAALLADRALAGADPGLDSVVNVNTPDDYLAAGARPPPEVTVQRFGALAGNGWHGPRTARAATVAAAAAAAELTLDRHVVAAVNGDRLSRDGTVPLVTGDTVAFLSADAGG